MNFLTESFVKKKCYRNDVSLKAGRIFLHKITALNIVGYQ